MHLFVERRNQEKGAYLHLHKQADKFQTTRANGDLSEMIAAAYRYHDKGCTLLLEEDHFDLYTVDLDFCATQKITATEMQSIVDERMNYIKSHYKA